MFHQYTIESRTTRSIAQITTSPKDRPDYGIRIRMDTSHCRYSSQGVRGEQVIINVSLPHNTGQAGMRVPTTPRPGQHMGKQSKGDRAEESALKGIDECERSIEVVMPSKYASLSVGRSSVDEIRGAVMRYDGLRYIYRLTCARL
jgi:hypothetical protein